MLCTQSLKSCCICSIHLHHKPSCFREEELVDRERSSQSREIYVQTESALLSSLGGQHLEECESEASLFDGLTTLEETFVDTLRDEENLLLHFREVWIRDIRTKFSKN